MKAIVQDAYGSEGLLDLRDIDRPVPGDDEVLVEVRAAGVGPEVWHLMTGRPYAARVALGLRRPKNPVRGRDGAGRVEAVGAKVTGFKAGDEVFGTCEGSFAEYARAKADRIVLKPAGLTFEQAAALPVSGMTALQALSGRSRPQPGQRVLVIGASGGVGTYAVQLATGYGAEVTGVCGPAGADLVRSLGATHVIDYTREGITEGPHRYDVIVDNAGLRPLSVLRRALTPRGALVIVGGEGGSSFLGGTSRGLRAVLLSPFVAQHLRNLVSLSRREDLLTLRDLTEKGRITPVVDRVYPLAEAPAAMRHLRQGHPRGKLVVTV
ncbi:NAD(P)-dependent alcohol dehydrogenase [Streptomyces qinzhouensis]|uniref:NAD(P)-dependent alcohol dehydrogenase n=1 Tax=Streptomyces qinzhouensis TaxID=2599401 RepID=A0A5B8JG80_9ACTN|nr:NAD(P)-dependent alcohol dehydrogenase [Streptomyces qinzhouensis]QDY75161.1 NAD(P)-dependent alcohol dehydrogenase [Streptomyces qinzhouensis]QDY80637.1 NAD(P)-dependent alcohol dehydrogenase [Streptomyces qinzhouensis]